MVNHLLKISQEDPSGYEVPTEEKVKVDRFAYLPNNANSEEVKEIK
jgi:hypothetical protein